MPSNVLFTNPVVAQQQMAADQYALQSRAQEQADRDALLSNIRELQRIQSGERVANNQVGAQRYQTEAYRDVATGQNQIGRDRLTSEAAMAKDKLELDRQIAENQKAFNNANLATQERIAQINANRSLMRPQDLVEVGRQAVEHNAFADDFNAKSKNAVAILQSMAAEAGVNKLKKDSWWTTEDERTAASKSNRTNIDLIRTIIGANPDFKDYVDISGDSLQPRMIPKMEVRNGMLVEVAQKIQNAPAPVPADQSMSGMDGGVAMPESNLARIRAIANGAGAVAPIQAGQTNGYSLPKYKGYGINVRN
jgi:hypothetical protein